MTGVENFINTMNKVHCEQAQLFHSATSNRRRRHSTMPSTAFIYEYFLFNSLYQIDWEESLKKDEIEYWSREDDLTELNQQGKFLSFIRKRCKENPSIVCRAFEAVEYIHDLAGKWTEIIPDKSVSVEKGQRFFRKLGEIQSGLRANTFDPTIANFKLIENCGKFIYFVRNNIFHGTKTLEQIFGSEQKQRIKVYETFIRGVVSLFFLSMGRDQVAADLTQLPVKLVSSEGIKIELSADYLLEQVTEEFLKHEDSRLINTIFKKYDPKKGSAAVGPSLFYPSAGKDVLCPLILGLPFCSEYFFYECDQKRWERSKDLVERFLQGKFKIVEDDRSASDQKEVIISFQFGNDIKRIHLVNDDNEQFFETGASIGVLFRRDDSQGNGGSGQEWDSRHILDVVKKGHSDRDILIVTDGYPGGVHKKLRNYMDLINIPLNERGREYHICKIAKEDALRILS